MGFLRRIFNRDGFEMPHDVQLALAVRVADVSSVKRHLKHGANPNTMFSEGDIGYGMGDKRPLISITTQMACRWEPNQKKYMKILELLLAHGADVNTRDIENHSSETPLLQAAGMGEVPVGKLLLKYNADVDIKNISGNTPLHLAYEYEHPEFVRLLLEHGANPNAENDNGEIPSKQMR